MPRIRILAAVASLVGSAVLISAGCDDGKPCLDPGLYCEVWIDTSLDKNLCTCVPCECDCPGGLKENCKCTESCECTCHCWESGLCDCSCWHPEKPAVHAGDCPDDPGEVVDGCGIHVSASLGDDKNDGSRAAPVRTFVRAIQLAEKAKMRVYACAETFPEAIVAPPGVSVIGGLDCNRDWQLISLEARTEVAPVAGVVPLTVEPGAAKGIGQFHGMSFRAADALAPGASSIGAIVNDGAVSRFVRCGFYAGQGAAGADGESRSGVAEAGLPGRHGAAACSADAPPGGKLVMGDCGGLISMGGPGGNGGLEEGAPGVAGSPPPVDGQGGGEGGAGEAAGAGCFAGGSGAPGNDGAHGAGGSGLGLLSVLGYKGVDGHDGAPGLPGQGGGGGGGSRAGSLVCGNKPKGGGGGGSGGSGGCGGRPGLGGGAGGSSIGLVVLGNPLLELVDSIAVAKNGGNGGNGGSFEQGGPGGGAGSGGSAVKGSLPGCSGGIGGRGGRGGFGGGGQGGHSLAMAFTGSQPAAELSMSMAGLAGKGGYGGNPGDATQTGGSGVTGAILQIPGIQ